MSRARQQRGGPARRQRGAAQTYGIAPPPSPCRSSSRTACAHPAPAPLACVRRLAFQRLLSCEDFAPGAELAGMRGALTAGCARVVAAMSRLRLADITQQARRALGAGACSHRAPLSTCRVPAAHPSAKRAPLTHATPLCAAPPPVCRPPGGARQPPQGGRRRGGRRGAFCAGRARLPLGDRVARARAAAAPVPGHAGRDAVVWERRAAGRGDGVPAACAPAVAHGGGQKVPGARASAWARTCLQRAPAPLLPDCAAPPCPQVHHALCEMLADVLRPLVRANQPSASAGALSPALLAEWHTVVLRVKNEVGQWTNKHNKHVNVSGPRMRMCVYACARPSRLKCLHSSTVCAPPPFPITIPRRATHLWRCWCASLRRGSTPSRWTSWPTSWSSR